MARSGGRAPPARLSPPATRRGAPTGSLATGGRLGSSGEAAARVRMSGLRGVTLTVRFLCELAMLAALAYWGFTVGEGVGAWLLGLGAPLLAAVVWGAVVAPRARWHCADPNPWWSSWRCSALLLAVAGQPLAAVILGVAALATSLLNASQERQERDRAPGPRRHGSR